jgi:anti-sigma factor RsiW
MKWRYPNMKCDLPIELLNGYLDGELDAQERARVEAHLRECEACQIELEVLKRLDEQVRKRVYEEPTREFVFTLNRRVMDTIRMAPRRSFFRFAPVFAPVAAALLILIVMINISPSKRIADIGDRMAYQELEPRKLQSVSIREPEIAQAPAAMKRTVRDQKEKAGAIEAEEKSVAESVDETELDRLTTRIPRHDQVVRAIIDTTGTVIKVATGNTLIPEKDTVLEKQLEGQQVAPPMIAGIKKQVYVEVTTETQKKE